MDAKGKDRGEEEDKEEEVGMEEETGQLEDVETWLNDAEIPIQLLRRHM